MIMTLLTVWFLFMGLDSFDFSQELVVGCFADKEHKHLKLCEFERHTNDTSLIRISEN